MKRRNTPPRLSRRQEGGRYRLAPSVMAQLVLWLAVRGLDSSETVARNDLIQMLIDWRMVRPDRHALQRAMNGTRIPERFPMAETHKHLLVYMLVVTGDNLLEKGVN